jgi:hypothetical protein
MKKAAHGAAEEQSEAFELESAIVSVEIAH